MFRHSSVPFYTLPQIFFEQQQKLNDSIELFHLQYCMNLKAIKSFYAHRLWSNFPGVFFRSEKFESFNFLSSLFIGNNCS